MTSFASIASSFFAFSPSPSQPPSPGNPHDILPLSSVATEKLLPADGSAILAQQRLRRPVSPHLDIYKMDQTWFGGSIWHRITGSVLSGGLYVFATAYVAAPLLGWHLESASLAAAFGALPLALKGGLKFVVAWPFTYHFVNGLKHLWYDLGYGFKKAAFNRQGWTVWGLSLVAGLYLGFGY
jgi:succinate dehydrogenase (ubiquinone) cytochrome b560 subunit